jgi:serine protease
MNLPFKRALCAGAISMAIAVPVTTQASSPVSENYYDNLFNNNHGLRFGEQNQNRYIVKFKSQPGLSAKAADQARENVLQKYGATVKRMLKSHNAAAVTLSAARAAEMANDPAIEYVEVDQKRYLTSIIKETGVRQYATSTSETSPYGIAMVQANQLSDSLAGNRKICIIDSGYDRSHEDLSGNNVTGEYDSVSGWWYNDTNSHGTHVGGTISAIGGNGKGVVGVLDSGTVQIHSVKVFDANGWSYSSDLVAALDKCTTWGANVVSMSLGGPSYNATENSAFASALSNGVLSIAAAGNAGNSSLSYPASYDSVMSVAAVDSAKNVASFSQYNSQVEIAGPGVQVDSTIPGNKYALYSGTSMATPHVSAVAALVWSYHTSCTASQIRAALTATAEDRGAAGRDIYYGYGIAKALDAKNYLDTYGCAGNTGGGGGGGTPGVTALSNGVPATGLSASTGQELMFKLDVPAGATNLSFAMSGGTGDADLYVKFGSQPTTSSYDCRPYLNGNSETCNISNVQTGTYYAMVRAYSTFSGVSLTGSYTAGSGGGGGGAATYTNNTNVTIRDRRTVTSSISVPRTGDSGTITVHVDIKHTYRGDLRIKIVAPNGAKATLKDINGSDSADNVLADYSVNASGVESSGTWKLEVYDAYSGDTGYIDTWSISFQ